MYTKYKFQNIDKMQNNSFFQKLRKHTQSPPKNEKEIKHIVNTIIHSDAESDAELLYEIFFSIGKPYIMAALEWYSSSEKLQINVPQDIIIMHFWEYRRIIGRKHKDYFLSKCKGYKQYLLLLLYFYHDLSEKELTEIVKHLNKAPVKYLRYFAIIDVPKTVKKQIEALIMLKDISN